MRRLAAGLLVLLVLLPALVHADDDELPRKRDNGREGTQNTFEGDDVPVYKACGDVRSRAGSLVTRRLPRGPERKDTSLAFTSGMCVYLPPGYATSGLRYPVLYLLHGGGGDQGEWVTFGHVQQVADRAYSEDKRNAVIIVIPDGTSDAGWFDAFDERYLNERYVLRYVVPYVDRHFRTIADRRGRVIDGLSNGGYGALHLAAKAPDLFVAAGSMSGNLGFRGDDGGQDPNNSPAYKEGNLPAPLAENLDGIDVVMDIGAQCFGDAARDLCAGFLFEQAFRADNEYFVTRMDDVGHKGVLDYRPTEGGHAWRWWTTWLDDRHLPFLLKRAADPQALASVPVRSAPRFPFRYRSVFKRFSVYGYDVTVTKRDVREFLDLTKVDRRGFNVRGSGKVRIRTAPLYEPGMTYSSKGAVTKAVTADATGRLSIDVDLGPSHSVEDASPEGRAMQEQPDYWTTKRIDVRPA
jgi:S-formylglutathione hydrolase FrmB